MKEIAIFGGTFDPPTRAHEAVVAACLERPDIDEVWLMPSGARPDKPAMSPNAARLAMLELVKATVFGNDERLMVTDFEQRLAQPSQTHRTVRELERTYPDNHFWYVYGADAYHHMPTWEEGNELRRNIGMLLVARSGHELPVERNNIRHMDLPAIHRTASSSEVRQALKANQSLEAVIGQAVLDYIQEEALYIPETAAPGTI